MVTISKQIRKITISLPEELVVFADQRAQEIQTSRSQVISQALAELRAAEEAQLAAEGYRFYAAEAEEFAASATAAVFEAIVGNEEIPDAR